jgi:hypothetical protein
MLLPLALHGMKAFIFIGGSAGKTQTTLYKTETVTLETVKLLETLEQYDVLESYIESRACHRHFRWSNGTSLSPHLPVNVAFLFSLYPFSVSLSEPKFFPPDSWFPSQLRRICSFSIS